MFWQENIDTQTKIEIWKQRGLLPGERQSASTGAGSSPGSPASSQLEPVEGLAHGVKCGPQRQFPEYKHRETREVGWGVQGCMDPLVLPLTLVDVLERTSPTEFHADPELLQPTGGQEIRDGNGTHTLSVVSRRG